MKAPKEAVINTLGGATLNMADNSLPVALDINKGKETILDLGLSNGQRTYVPFHAVETGTFHMVDVNIPTKDDTCATSGSDPYTYTLEDKDGVLYYNGQAGNQGGGAALLLLVMADVREGNQPKLKVGDTVYNYDRNYSDMGGMHYVFTDGTKSIDVRNANISYMS